MPVITLTLNDREAEALRDMLPAGPSRQDLIRAALYLLDQEGTAELGEVRRRAEQGVHIETGAAPGLQKGLGVGDYRAAIAEAGSLQGAARLLGVNRATVREVAATHAIEVPSLGGVPD